MSNTKNFSTAAKHGMAVSPLSAEQRRQFDDIEWARHDSEVLERYSGQFVVPYQRRIVAHGDDLEAVLAEAAQLMGMEKQKLPVVALENPLLEINDFDG